MQEEDCVNNPSRILQRGRLALGLCLCILAVSGCAVVEWPVKKVTQVVKEIKKPTLKQAVVNLLASPDPDVRRESLNTISEYKTAKGDAFIIETVGTVLNGDPARNVGPDKSQLVRAAAAHTLGIIGETRVAIPILLTAMGDEDNTPLVRQELVRALGNIGAGDQRVIDKLLAVARSKNEHPDVRQKAAESLGDVADESLLPELLALMKEEKRGELRVALGARDALRRITGKPFGATDPDVWLLWAEEAYNQEIVDRYVAGQLEMEKLRPTPGPIAQRIPANIRRVFEGIGAELILSGKSVVDAGLKLASAPVGAARFAIKGPRGALRGRPGTGLFGGIGLGVKAVGAGMGSLGRGIVSVVPGGKPLYRGISDGLEKLGKTITKAYNSLFHPREEVKVRTQSSD